MPLTMTVLRLLELEIIKEGQTRYIIPCPTTLPGPGLPRSAPAPNEAGLLRGRVRGPVLGPTDGDYHSAFLGHPGRRGAVRRAPDPSATPAARRDPRAAAGQRAWPAHGHPSSTTQPNHSDTPRGSAIFGSNVTRIRARGNAGALLRDNDPGPARPRRKTFRSDRYTWRSAACGWSEDARRVAGVGTAATNSPEQYLHPFRTTGATS